MPRVHLTSEDKNVIVDRLLYGEKIGGNEWNH